MKGPTQERSHFPASNVKRNLAQVVVWGDIRGHTQEMEEAEVV